MSRIVEMVKCPECRCNMVKGEACIMCDDVAWAALNEETVIDGALALALAGDDDAPYYMGNEDLPQSGE